MFFVPGNIITICLPECFSFSLYGNVKETIFTEKLLFRLLSETINHEKNQCHYFMKIPHVKFTTVTKKWVWRNKIKKLLKLQKNPLKNLCSI